jgi:hypothetical protein
LIERPGGPDPSDAQGGFMDELQGQAGFNGFDGLTRPAGE